jgi:gluconate 2-dehydrogenase gamma chain
MSFFTDIQARQVAAIAERIFPSGPNEPGAVDAHVVQYIDLQLTGEWGQGARMYQQGPFVRPDHTGHGWQSPMTPAQSYSYGLRALDEYTSREFGRQFADLLISQQDHALYEMSEDRIDTFEELTGGDFFNLLRQNVIEGLFADPAYGGNYQLVGWRWVGYPGVASAHGADYATFIERFDEPYSVEPRPLP